MTDQHAPRYVVSTGITGTGGRVTYATYERKVNGSLRRVCSPALPLRATKEEAEADLAAWLTAKGERIVRKLYPGWY